MFTYLLWPMSTDDYIEKLPVLQGPNLTDCISISYTFVYGDHPDLVSKDRNWLAGSTPLRNIAYEPSQIQLGK